MSRTEDITSDWTSLALAMPWPRPRNPNAVVVWPEPKSAPRSPVADDEIREALARLEESSVFGIPASEMKWSEPWDCPALAPVWTDLATRLRDGGWHPAAGTAHAVARSVGVSPGTVRSLVRRLVLAGVLADRESDRTPRGGGSTPKDIRLVITLEWGDN